MITTQGKTILTPDSNSNEVSVQTLRFVYVANLCKDNGHSVHRHHVQILTQLAGLIHICKYLQTIWKYLHTIVNTYIPANL